MENNIKTTTLKNIVVLNTLSEMKSIDKDDYDIKSTLFFIKGNSVIVHDNVMYGLDYNGLSNLHPIYRELESIKNRLDRLEEAAELKEIK